MRNGNNMGITDSNFFEQLRIALRPKGTSPIVRLFLRDNSYYKEPYVQECIDELEHKINLVSAGLHEFTNLERLSINVLMDSSYMSSYNKDRSNK